MTEYVWTQSTARKRHRCELCRRVVLPGEAYWRIAGLDNGHAWTYKSCWHCCRVGNTWSRSQGEPEWFEECILEWLQDEHPAIYACLLAGWRFPDGELLPLPFTPHCITCGRDVTDGAGWCDPCDERRIDRARRQLESLLGYQIIEEER